MGAIYKNGISYTTSVNDANLVKYSDTNVADELTKINGDIDNLNSTIANCTKNKRLSTNITTTTTVTDEVLKTATRISITIAHGAGICFTHEIAINRNNSDIPVEVNGVTYTTRLSHNATNGTVTVSVISGVSIVSINIDYI